MNHDDLLADLPSPRDDEPPSLRSDIADELLDHLQCAFRREVLKDGDEAAAEKRALARFGDPKKLARRLWRQAMWSRIMGKRILSGLQWLLTLAAAFLAGAVLWQQSQLLTELNAQHTAEAHWRQGLSMTLNDLRSRLPVAIPPAAGEGEAAGGGSTMFSPMGMMGMGAGPGKSEPPTLTVKLVQETEDGPPVTGLIEEITITGGGKTVYGSPHSLPPGMGGLGVTRIFSANGQFLFNTLEPDRYELKIVLADGQYSTQQVLIRGDKPQELTVVCPGPRKKVPVLITVPPLPEDLRDLQLQFTVEEQGKTIDKVHWYPTELTTFDLLFDEETGQLQKTQQTGKWSRNEEELRSVDMTQVPAEDRVIFVLTGGVGVRFQLHQKVAEFLSDVFPIRFPVPESKNSTVSLQRFVIPGEDVWKLELPEELIAEARKQMASDNSKPQGADEPAKADGEPARAASLTVQLVQDAEDGPAVTKADVSLVRDGTKIPSSDVGEPAAGDRLFRHSGKYQFQNLPRERYELTITLPDGQHSTRLVLIRNDKPQELTVVCPGPRTNVPVTITTPPLPDEIRAANLYLVCTVIPGPIELGKGEWTMPVAVQQLLFDGKTGHVKWIKPEENRKAEDVSRQPLDERVVFLPAGPVVYRFALYRPADHAPAILASPAAHPGEPTIEWFSDSIQDQSSLVIDVAPDTHVLQPDENRWELELPESLLNAARKGLTKPKDAEAKPGDATKPENDSNAAAPGASLQLITVGEHDGKPVKDFVVTLYRDAGDRTAIPEEIASKSMDDQGLVSFTGLKSGLHVALVTSRINQLSSGFRFDLVDGQATANAVVAPTNVQAARLAFRTNLPDDLAEAGVKLSFRMTSQHKEVNRQEWRFVGKPLESFVVGPKGYEGVLQLPRVRRDLRQAFLDGRHRLVESTEREITVPALSLWARDLTLICPASDRAEGEDDPRWIVCATPVVPKRGESGEVPFDSGGREFQFQPAVLQSNEWSLPIPEEMITAARQKLAELKAK